MKLKGKSSKVKNSLWEGVDESHFVEEKGIDEVEIGEYDKECMTMYAANTNLFRQLVRLSDSLKPVERNTLYALYLLGAKPGHKVKSAQVVSTTMKYHPHGDQVCYGAMVTLTQPWTKQCPTIKGIGNYGNSARPDFFAHYRYTEAYLSKYGYECFFEDYDPDCVETIFNTSSDSYVPMGLPSKFPNILVNGGFGFAFGNSFRIPPYNIKDVVENVTKLLKNPLESNIFMVPDFPCDCDIVDDGTELHNIIDQGNAVLKMRGRINIEEYGKHWLLRITSAPWMVNFASVVDRIHQLAKDGVLSIMDTMDGSYVVKMPDGSVETRIDFGIVINNAHDPNVIREKLYNLTELQKPVSINFKVVTDNLTVERLNMKDLIMSWIDERRSYLRRLYNKKYTHISARIELLNILIYLLRDDKNIQRTIKVIRGSREDEVCSNLQKLCEMSSYQARKIADMPIRTFNADTRKKSEEELVRLEKQKKEVLQIIKSEAKIDAIIADQLQDLLKYAKPRRTHVIEPTTATVIQDTNHNVIVTRNGFVKKLMDSGNSKFNMGAFKTGDYPTYYDKFNNHDSIIFFDNFGRYSIVPIHKIENNEPNQYGHTIYSVAKLSGKIVSVTKHLSEDTVDVIKKLGKPYMITVTSQGYIKKTPLEDFMKIRNTKNVRCMKVRDDDSLVYADIVFGNKKLLIYTKKGKYVYLTVESIPEQAKDTMGLIGIKPDMGDEVKGISIIGDKDEFVGVVTTKGIVKKTEVKYLGDPVKRSSTNSHTYLTTLEVGDEVFSAIPMREDCGMTVCTLKDVYNLEKDQIPIMSRKAKGKKLVPVPLGVNIIRVFEYEAQQEVEELPVVKKPKPKVKSKAKPKAKKKVPAVHTKSKKKIK